MKMRGGATIFGAKQRKKVSRAALWELPEKTSQATGFRRLRIASAETIG